MYTLADETLQSLLNILNTRAFASIAGTFVLALFTLTCVYLYDWNSFMRSRLWVRRELKHRRSGQFMVTLDLYVALLERFREMLIKRYSRNIFGRYFNVKQPKATLFVCAFTRQLPRNWPLWGADELEQSAGLVPLEDYFIQFCKFLKRADSDNYSVDVKRVIVIDNCGGTTGKEKFAELKVDVKDPLIATYFEKIHKRADDARFFLYRRPWPNWLSDVVFYGIRQGEDGALKWLYAIATSYDAGEDLILLRLFRLKDHTPAGKYLTLPNGCKDLEDLANMSFTSKDVRPLSELQAVDLRDPDNVPDAQTLTTANPSVPSPLSSELLSASPEAVADQSANPKKPSKRRKPPLEET